MYLSHNFLLFVWKNHVHVNYRLNIVYNHWQNAENSTLRQKLNESYKEAENVQISRAETINRLTRSLEESQKQCQMLLESGSQSYSLLSWWYWQFLGMGPSTHKCITVFILSIFRSIHLPLLQRYLTKSVLIFQMSKCQIFGIFLSTRFIYKYKDG